MKKLTSLILFVGIYCVPTEAVVRGLKLENENVAPDDRESSRRHNLPPRRTQESFFGPQHTTHIGHPVSIPVGAPLIGKEIPQPPTPWTALKYDVTAIAPATAPPQPEKPEHSYQEKWSDDRRRSSSGKGKGGGGKGGSYYSHSGSLDAKGKGKGKAYSSKESGSKSVKGKGGSISSGKGKGSYSHSAKPPKKKESEKGTSKKHTGSKMSKIGGKGSSRPTHFPPAPSRPPSTATTTPTRPPVTGECRSRSTLYVLNRVPEAIGRNPERCCDFKGPSFAIVTHAQPDLDTESGFSSYWNDIYFEIEKSANQLHVCFFMTGINASFPSGRSTSEIMVNVNQIVSGISSVPAIMTTDPTSNVDLMNTVRGISENPGLPSIGVFNSGYDNLVVESLVSGKMRLPYVGSTSDESYGDLAAAATLRALNNVPPVALCYNNGDNATQARCQDYYNNLRVSPPNGVTSRGLLCSHGTTDLEIFTNVTDLDANVLWAHQDCCEAAAAAVERARSSGSQVILGCMDVSSSTYQVDFVTAQPIQLQAHAASAWASFPVMQELKGRDGRGPQFFPSLTSLIRTAIQSVTTT